MFRDVVNLVPEGISGNCEIQHHIVPRTCIQRGHKILRGEYCMLMVDGKLMMSDQHKEWVSSRPIMENARGSVLIAGLGIGLILPSLIRNPKVHSIRVVEKNANVISLVSPYYESEKLKISHADINEWYPRKEVYQAIWLDIWPDINAERIPEMESLVERCKPWLSEDCKAYKCHRKHKTWIGVWGLEEAISLKNTCCKTHWINNRDSVVVCSGPHAEAWEYGELEHV